MTNLIKYLPEFWHDIREMNGIQSGISPSFDVQKTDIDALLDQCFIQTATVGLALWEKEFGIVTNPQLTNEERRAELIAKLQSTDTSTKAKIKHTAETIMGIVCVLSELNDIYAFEIALSGLPPNKAILKNAIETCKPAHLAFYFYCNDVNWMTVKTQNWSYYMDTLWFGRE